MALDFQQLQNSGLRADLPQDTDAVAPFRGEEVIADILDRAEQLIDDEEAAAFLLDGLPRNIVAQWYARQQRRAPRADQALAELEEVNAEIAWQLRHALRALDVQARLGHLRVLFQMVRS